MKKILILGASSDIGLKVTKLFLKQDWQVYAHFNSGSQNLKKIFNKNLKLIQLNFLDNSENIDKKIDFLKNIKFDGFVNLTGYIDNKGFTNFDLEECINALKVNTIVPLLILKLIHKLMIKSKFGRILLTSSIGTKFGGGKNTFGYSLSKKANEFIPRDYKIWAEKNVLINCLIIGVTDTKIHKRIQKKDKKIRKNLIPIKRMAKAEEIAKYIFFLINDNSYITGQVISISGGE